MLSCDNVLLLLLDAAGLWMNAWMGWNGMEWDGMDGMDGMNAMGWTHEWMAGCMVWDGMV